MTLAAPTEATTKRIQSDYYVEGYALTYGPYELFKDDDYTVNEDIARTAFTGTDMSDVILQFDHEGFVYARTSNGTLGMELDEHGLLIWADLSKTSRGRQLFEDIQSGMVTKMSFRASADCDFEHVNEHEGINHIQSIRRLYDVSAVSIPANDGTEIVARMKNAKNKHADDGKDDNDDALKLKLKLKLGGK